MEESYIYKPFRYFLIVNLINWLAFIIAAYFSYKTVNHINGLINSVLIIIGMLVPFGTVLWMILLSDNKDLQKNFLNKLSSFNLIKLPSLPTIFLILPASATVSILLSCLFGQSLDQFILLKGAIYYAGAILAPLILFGATCFEELWWKGYGMDSLRSKYISFTA